MQGVTWRHFLAGAALFLLYLYGVNRVGLLSHDEPRYASIGREMAASGDWITPRLWGQPWFEKPALLYWMIAAGYRAGLGDDFAPRLPVALLCAAFLFFYFHWLRREFGEMPALYATLMLGTSAGWLAYGQTAVTDLPLAATFSAALLLCLPWVRSGGRRGLVIGGVLLGLAVLAKGPLPLVLAAPLAWIGRRRWKDLLLYAGSALAVASPWYLLCWHRNGTAFINEFLWKQNFGRFFSPDLQHVQPLWYYVPIFAGLLFPWTPAIFTLFQKSNNHDSRQTLLLASLLSGLLFFSVSRNKLPGYLLPLLPGACALMGIRLSATSDRKWILPLSGLLLAVVPVAAVVFPQALASGLGDVSLQSIPFAGVFAGIAIGSACLWAEMRGRRTVAVLLVSGGTLGGVLLIKINTYPVLDTIASARPLWRSVADRRENVCVEDLRRAWRYGLNFYSRVPLPDCSVSPKPLHLVQQGDRPPAAVNAGSTL